ncbi:MAG: diadenylate cyclase [Bacteroidia bacterium]|nr:diadenylate cyclase [Bacteroidia bacterium]MDW8133655.1 diadenylate cyclase [Bacteroidia bacterium]
MEIFRIGLIPITWRDGIDILLLALLLYGALRWFYRTNLLGVALFLLILTIFLKITSLLGLLATSFLLKNLLTWIGLVLAVLMAPELRRLLYSVRLLPGLGFLRKGVITEEKAEKLAEELIESLQLLARNNLGALIVIEGNDDLNTFIQTGDAVQMPVEARMFLVIFEKRSPLHDGAAIVRGDKIVAVRCTLPLSERLDLPQTLGQRHRAAIGITEQADAMTLVVSEETGLISIAQRGELRRALPLEIKKQLISFYLRP